MHTPAGTKPRARAGRFFLPWTLGAVAAAALLAGGGVYWWQTGLRRLERARSEERVAGLTKALKGMDELKREVDELRRRLAEGPGSVEERNELLEEAKRKEKTLGYIIGERAKQVIQAVKARDFEELATFVHPEKGVRFSPYAWVDLRRDLVFAPEQVGCFGEDDSKYRWGVYDGSGAPIRLTPGDYFRKFVYNADYARAKDIGYNRVIGRSLTDNSSFAVYPRAIIVEFHFSGFDPAYLGMDWKSLRLAFEWAGDAWYLVGMINDQWAI